MNLGSTKDRLSNHHGNAMPEYAVLSSVFALGCLLSLQFVSSQVENSIALPAKYIAAANTGGGTEGSTGDTVPTSNNNNSKDDDMLGQGK